MIDVLHVIQHLTCGGGARAMVGVAKYSALTGDYRHTICSLLPPAEDGLRLAQDHNLEVFSSPSIDDVHQRIRKADIVHVHWWNNPELNSLLHSSLPECRMISWFHVGGHKSPHILSRDIIEYFDLSIACSPHTYNAPAFKSLPNDYKVERTGMAYGATDFSRIMNVSPVPHDRFTIGYIGTVDFVKMHPDFFPLSAQINIPNAAFIICGSGSAVPILQDQSIQAGRERDFFFTGYLEDITLALQQFDVYGYPLCEETYAASELNLQEVMFAGVPPVVFPYGGIPDLVMNNYTGLIVNSSREYKEAIEYLYHNPEERHRLGQNAKEYARQIFGAERAAQRFNFYYEKLLRFPKRTHTMSLPCTSLVHERPLEACDIFFRNDGTGADRFIHSLGNDGDDFIDRLIAEKERAPLETKSVNQLMSQSGIYSYANSYPHDDMLQIWSAQNEIAQGNIIGALERLVMSISHGNRSVRLLTAATTLAKEVGLEQLATELTELNQ